MKRVILAAALCAGLSGVAMAADNSASTQRTPCFFLTQWKGWKSPDPSTLYLGVNVRDVYEVKLSAPSSQLSSPGAHLVSKTRGSNSICSPLDLDLKVAQRGGFSTPLIAKSLRKLSPDEVAAIPKKYRP